MAGSTNHQPPDPAASPPKARNDAVAVTPDNRNSINVDDEEDSVTKSIISIDDNKKDGVVSDDAMTGSGLTIVPTGSTSTDNFATVGGAPSVNFSLIDDTGNDAGNNDTNDNTGNQDNVNVSMGGVNSEHNAGEEGAADSKSIDLIEKEIADLLYIIGTSTGDTRGTKPEDLLTGGALNVVKAELVYLQRSLEEKKKTATCDIVIGENSGNVIGKPVASAKETLGSYKIGGKNTVDALAEQVLLGNTTNNALSSILAGNINNSVTPVWKFSQHHQRLASIAAMSTMIWNKIKPLKTVQEIESIPTTTKFKLLWSKFSSDPLSPDTPVAKISKFISAIEKKKEDWTKSPEARGMLTNSFCALSKTSPEVFGVDWKRAGELHPSPAASLWTAAVKALGCSFKITVHFKLTKKGILKSDIKNLKASGKSLTFDVASVCVQTKAGRFLVDKVDRQPFAKKIRVEKQFTRNHQSYIQVQSVR